MASTDPAVPQHSEEGRLPLEPGVIAYIAAMASHFGQRQSKTKQPKQNTKTTNTASEHPNPLRNRGKRFFFVFFPGGGGGGGGNVR